MAVVVACVLAAAMSFVAGRATAPDSVVAPSARSPRADDTPPPRPPAVASPVFTARQPDRVARAPATDDGRYESPLRIDEATNSIGVLLVIDRDDRDHEAVDRAVTRAMDAASAELDRQFGVKLRVTEIQTLRLGEEPWNSRDAMDKLTARYTPRHGDLLLAFGPRPHVGDRRDDPDWGVARYYGSHAMVFLEPGDAEWRAAPELILHEVGHVLGAWHSPAKDSVMRPYVEGAAATTFDPVSVAVIRNTLEGMNSSASGTTAERLARLMRLAAESPPPAPGERAAVIDMLVWIAADARQRGRTNDARRFMQQAMELAKKPGMCTPEQANELEEGH